MSAPEVRRIRNILAQRESARRLGALLGMLAGVPLCLIGPVLLGSAFWFAANALGVAASWWDWTCGMALVLLPLLAVRAWRTAPGPLDEYVAAGEKPTPSMFARYSGAHVGLMGAAWMPILANPRLFGAGVTELFLIGPRAVVGGLRAWRLAQRIGRVDRIRAAEIVQALLQRGEGIAVSRLKRGGDSDECMLAALNYLLVYGWIGMRAGSDFVYLYSEARQRLRGV